MIKLLLVLNFIICVIGDLELITSNNSKYSLN